MTYSAIVGPEYAAFLDGHDGVHDIGVGRIEITDLNALLRRSPDDDGCVTDDPEYGLQIWFEGICYPVRDHTNWLSTLNHRPPPAPVTLRVGQHVDAGEFAPRYATIEAITLNDYEDVVIHVRYNDNGDTEPCPLGAVKPLG